MTTTDVLNAIATGTLDGGLARIVDAARQRQRDALPDFSPGDTARISVLARPKYLARMGVKVLSVTRKKAYIRFDIPALAGKYGPECNVPLFMLEKVD